MLIFFLLFPLIIYAALYFLFPARRTTILIPGAIAVAFISLATLIYAVSTAAWWTDGKRVAWTGVKSHNQEISIGGATESALVGWTNNMFAPLVKARLVSGHLEMEISGGAGFVFDEKGGRYLNGDLLEHQKTKDSAGYVFIKKDGWLRNQLEIKQADKSLVQIELPAVRRDTVFNLDALIEKETRSLTPEGETNVGWGEYFFSFFTTPERNPKEKYEAVENLKIRAQEFRLLVRINGEARLLGIEAARGKNCELPCRLTIRWANGKVAAEFAQSPRDNNLVLQYRAPLRNFSPLPPPEAKNKLTITNQPAPGDYAYVLPLGNREKLAESDGFGRTWAILDLKPPENKTPNTPEVFEQKDPLTPCNFLVEEIEAQQGCRTIKGKNVDFVFSFIEDYPSVLRILGLSIMALLIFAFGLIVARKRLSTETAWAVFGLTTCVWNFLMLRLILALRYALDPSYLDETSVSGVTSAFVALALMPGFMLLLTRLRCDADYEIDDPNDLRISQYLSFALLVMLALFSLLVFYLSGGLWANLPPETYFSFSNMSWLRLISVLALVGGVFGYLWLHTLILYQYKSGAYFQNEEKFFTRLVKFVFLDVWSYPKKFIYLAKDFWLETLGDARISRRSVWHYSRWIFVFGVLGFLLFLYSGTRMFATQIYFPFLLCWFPVLIWLAAKNTEGDYSETTHWKRRRVIFYIALLTLLPAFFMPFAFFDVGAIYAVLAVFLLLVLILLKRARGTRLFGVIAGLMISLCLIFAFVFYLKFDFFSSYLRGFAGEAAPRVLAFKQGANFPNYLLSSDTVTEGNELGLSVYDIINTYEHLWENKAIAHEGGFSGFGFGNAPVRLSQVRQDTVQFDSVFSFYILGDYGLIGGFFLLLLYFMPLVFVYLGGRSRFDIGFAVALIIAGSFLLEGLTHAAMNLWVLPFTGRNLPLLSIHSVKGDFLRWLILFAFAVNAMFWRNSKNGELSAEAVSVFDREQASPTFFTRWLDKISALAAEANAARLRFNWRRVPAFYAHHSETWRQIFLLIALPSLLFLLTISSAFLIWRAEDVDVFSWDNVREHITWAVENEIITVSQEKGVQADCPHINLNEGQYRLRWKGANDETTFLNQQINRFNALSCDDRIGKSSYPNIMTVLSGASDYQKYQNFLNELRDKDEPSKRVANPNLLTVEPVSRNYSLDGFPYVAVFNPEFNLHKTFKVEQKQERVPSIGLAGGERLVGAAWVKGKWIAAYNPNPKLLSWTQWMADSMGVVWSNIGNEKASGLYKELSLERRLHPAAVAFVDRKGIELQKQKPPSSAVNKDAWKSSLPTRIGLTVMRLSSGADNGAILGLGGFPRSASGNQWQKLCYEKDCLLLPPAKTVEKKFPPILKTLYNNDRNFEPIAMGSSTKPMWTAAVLATHPKWSLENTFAVPNGDGQDTFVFGLKISDKPWTVHGTAASPVDFKHFLAESNNRYQVHLGFLGLARENENNDKAVATETEKFNEIQPMIMNGKPWNKIPKFDDELVFGVARPEELQNVHNTDLAKRLRALFGVKTSRKYIFGTQDEDFGSYMNSFWTKNEADDVPGRNRLIQKALSPAILPARTNLKLDRIRKSREYVTWLLGGGENRWSNVQAAAAFGSVVTGRRILPHIVKNDVQPEFYNRDDNFFAVAGALRPGLRAVAMETYGTAYKKFSPEAQSFLKELEAKGYLICAKTGTLDETDGEISRLILAIVRFEDAERKKVKNGLVFSLYVEVPTEGKASGWLGDFLTENKNDILQLLSQ